MDKLLIANWKMQLTHNEACTWLETELSSVRETLAYTEHELVICPSFTVLPYATFLYEGLPWGAQDCGLEPRGAYTGDVSALSLGELGISYTLVGHSERRQHYGETNEQVRKKTSIVLNQGIHPVVCIGETSEQRSRRSHVLQEQLEPLLDLYTRPDDLLIIAYEPVWAIGSGTVPSPDDLAETLETIEKFTSGLDYLILYGGSVNENHAKLLSPLVDGFLIGSASLDSEVLKKIILSC